MEFFGITLYGPQNYMNDIMREEYKEPMTAEEVKPMMDKIKQYSTLPKHIERPDVNIVRSIDIYMGRVNGFAYGSMQTFKKMKRKGVIKPPFPCDMYRLPPATSVEYGWWQHDPAILQSDWHVTRVRRPQPAIREPIGLALDDGKRPDGMSFLGFF